MTAIELPNKAAFTMSELARICRVDYRTVKRWRKARKFTCIKPGWRVLVPRKSAEEFLSRRTFEARKGAE